MTSRREDQRDCIPGILHEVEVRSNPRGGYASVANGATPLEDPIVVRLACIDEVPSTSLPECLLSIARWAVQAHRRRSGQQDARNARETRDLCTDYPLDRPAHSAKMLTDKGLPDCTLTEEP